jgi:hypothetical protein
MDGDLREAGIEEPHVVASRGWPSSEFRGVGQSSLGGQLSVTAQRLENHLKASFWPENGLVSPCLYRLRTRHMSS